MTKAESLRPAAASDKSARQTSRLGLTSPLPVSWSQVAAFRLSRHHLLERAPARSLISVVRNMAGAQAQVLSAAQISLWSRLSDLKVANIQAALGARTLARATCMRGTLYLLPSRDLALFVRGSAGRFEREIRWMRGKGFSDRDIDRLTEAVLGALDSPLTRRELAERVSRALGVRMGAAQGAGWGNRTPVPAVPMGGLMFPVVYLLHVAAARGVVCSGPSRANEPTFVRADAWIPRWGDMPREQAEGKLLRRYLRAFGPATPSDFALWAGMPLRDARQIWAREEKDFSPVSVQGWAAAVLREDVQELAQAGFERPSVRLLPYFDTYLLSHVNREHLVARQDHQRVYRAQGWIAPVVLVDGRAVATWAHAWEGSRLRVKVTRFAAISRRVTAGLREEAHDLGRFLGSSNVDVQID